MKPGTVTDLRLVPGMFQMSGRIRPFIPILRRLPAVCSRAALAALAIGDGIVRWRLTAAAEWAGAQGVTGVARWRLALAVLANHGRFVGDELMLGVEDLGELRQGARIHGAEYLESAHGGAILLGFHLGPPRTPYVLRAFGYPVTSAGRLEGTGSDSRWDEAVDAGAVVRLPDGTPADRVEGLNRLRRLLQNGSIIYLTADGPFGREAFRIDLPGRPLVVRAGWLALRRLSGVRTFPVLTHQHRGQRVIVVHPPLPSPQADPVRDAETCRDALGPLVLDYVRRFPTQCRYLAFPAWPSNAGDRA